jgi:adenylate cyclase
MPVMKRVPSLIRDLQRRRVFRVAAVYLLVGWGLVEVVVNTFPYLPLPEWMITAVIVLVALGFPAAVFLAWAFDLEIVRDAGPATAATSTAPDGIGARLFPRIWKGGASAAVGRDARTQRAARQGGTAPPTPDRVNRAVFANLRHELRNPLNAVIGYSEMVLEDVPEDLQATRAGLTRLRGQARALLPLIDAFVPPREAADVEAPAAADVSQLPRMTEAAHELAAGAQALVAVTPDHVGPELLQDVGRIAAAATRLITVLAELEARQIDGAESESLRESRAVAERVLARVQLLEHSAITTVSACILVVDDNGLNRDLLCRQLARSGFTVASANGGAEALQRLRTGSWDLVLLDVMMPDIDGLEVLERIQLDERLNQVPVIMISALDEIDSVVRCLEMGAIDYLTKPFDPVLLRARISAVLELRQLRDNQRRLSRNLLDAEDRNERLVRGLLPQPWPDGTGALRDCVQVLPDAAVMVAALRGTAAFADPDELLSTVRDYAATFRRLAEQYPVRALSGGRRLVAFTDTGDSADRAGTLVQLALELCGTAPRAGSAELNPGVGIQAGPLVVGIDYGDQVICGVWGEAIDVAERLAANAAPSGVCVAPCIHAQLSMDYASSPCGIVEFDNGTQMRGYRIRGTRGHSESTRPVLGARGGRGAS